MALSLPSNPDLEHLRRDARRLQRAVRGGDRRGIELVARHHPQGVPDDPASFGLAAAQLVVARGHGFSSWPRMLEYLRAARPLWRDPAALDPTAHDPLAPTALAPTALDATPVDAPLDPAPGPPRDATASFPAVAPVPGPVIAALACLTYTERDEPARWARAVDVLAAHPGLADRDVVVAAVAGDAAALRTHLAAGPGAATRDAGPFRWPPLLYLVYSRIPQRDPMEAARVLLDAGADPDSGYLWQGLPTPFTALTGALGEGENGPGRQPRHPRWRELAELLLAHGADPNDRQALYNRMFNRDDSHLELLLAHGLGRPSSEVWTRRIGSAGESVEEMMQRQLHWAEGHGFARRLELLAAHGHVLTPADAPAGGADGPAPRAPAIHRAATPEAVRAAAAEGADLDARHDGRTALHQAAFMGDAELVEALLDVGADPDAVDATHGSTAAGWAEWARHDELATLIRDHGPGGPGHDTTAR